MSRARMERRARDKEMDRCFGKGTARLFKHRTKVMVQQIFDPQPGEPGWWWQQLMKKHEEKKKAGNAEATT